MKIKQSVLVQELQHLTQIFIQQAQSWETLSAEELNWKEHEDSWSILECLEHLNLYGDFYLPEIEKQILKASTITDDPVFKGGWLGNYFANSMWPRNGKIKKMKTFKDKDPKSSTLPISTLQRFIEQQRQILKLLDMAQKVNMTKTTTGISIASWLRLRLGDTFRFVIKHNQRHMYQAKQVQLYIQEKATASHQA